MNGNWWIGLSVMHTLFAREHNAIVDRLRIDYPDGRRRMAVPEGAAGQRGADRQDPHDRVDAGADELAGGAARHARQLVGHARRGLSSAPTAGSATARCCPAFPARPPTTTRRPTRSPRSSPRSTACTRLIPDEFSFRRHDDDERGLRADFLGVTRGEGARRLYDEAAVRRRALFAWPPAIRARWCCTTIPNGLRKMPRRRQAAEHDESSLHRSRRHRHPARPRARRAALLRVPPPSRHERAEELRGTDRRSGLAARAAGGLRRGREGRPAGRHAGREQVDRNGTPPGFGFSDTAFRIFILMASRRLKSDRFFTEDFTPEVYTPAGFDWMRDNSFRSVLRAARARPRGAFRRRAQRVLPLAQGRG